jgi:hypothetical protein
MLQQFYCLSAVVQIPARGADNACVEGFLAGAGAVLQAGAQSAAVGEPFSCWTVLVGSEEGLVLIEGNHTPLEALRLERGARAAYRLNPDRGSLVLEGRSSENSLVLTAVQPATQPGYRGQDVVLYDLAGAGCTQVKS